MKQDIENIIKKNLPDDKIGRYEHNGEIVDIYAMEYCSGFNQALSQINTSLIADEVLKVVVEVCCKECRKMIELSNEKTQ